MKPSTLALAATLLAPACASHGNAESFLNNDQKEAREEARQTELVLAGVKQFGEDVDKVMDFMTQRIGDVSYSTLHMDACIPYRAGRHPQYRSKNPRSNAGKSRSYDFTSFMRESPLLPAFDAGPNNTITDLWIVPQFTECERKDHLEVHAFSIYPVTEGPLYQKRAVNENTDAQIHLREWTFKDDYNPLCSQATVEASVVTFFMQAPTEEVSSLELKGASYTTMERTLEAATIHCPQPNPEAHRETYHFFHFKGLDLACNPRGSNDAVCHETARRIYTRPIPVGEYSGFSLRELSEKQRADSGTVVFAQGRNGSERSPIVHQIHKTNGDEVVVGTALRILEESMEDARELEVIARDGR